MADNRALIVVDVQNDFCPGGALAVPDGDAVVPVINGLMDSFGHVILTQDWHPPGHQSFASSHDGREPYQTIGMPYGEQVLWPDHCVQATDGAAFHPGLRLEPAEIIVRKGFRAEIDSYSGFYENDKKTATGLAGLLRERGLTQLFVCGLATDFCVAWTAMDGARLGFQVALIEDASRAIDLDGSLAAAREACAEAGVGWVRSVEVES